MFKENDKNGDVYTEDYYHYIINGYTITNNLNKTVVTIRKNFI